MKGLKYFVCIANSAYMDAYMDVFTKHKVNNVLMSLGVGTASFSKLDIMGLKDNEKTLFHMIVRDEYYKEFCDSLIEDLHLDESFTGVGFFIPIDCLGGESCKRFFIGEEPIIKKEEEEMNINQSKCVVIISIFDKGHVEKVMGVAREAGATGGTIVKAKGAGTDIAKFFGISISEEKEMLYIIASREKRDDIMYAIMDNVGPNTDAHGIAFSLPIDKVVGIKPLEKLFD